MKIEEDTVFIKKGWFSASKKYAINDIKDFRWFLSKNSLVSRTGAMISTENCCRLIFKDGFEFEFFSNDYSNFFEIREYLFNRLKTEEIVDFSWITEIKKKDTERRKKRRR